MGPMAVVTEDKVKNMINDGLVQYERHFGEVRHKENSQKFDELFGELNKMRGGFFFGKLIAGFIAFLCMAILGLLSYLASHRQQSEVLVTHPTTLADSQRASF